MCSISYYYTYIAYIVCPCIISIEKKEKHTKNGGNGIFMTGGFYG